MLVAERFIASFINTYDKKLVLTDGGSWYPQACRFLKVDHTKYIHPWRKV